MYITATLAAAAFLAAPLSAQAAGVTPLAGGSCSASTQKKVVNNAPDQWRVNAKCTSLQANSEARGNLNIPAGTDAHTQWFTLVNAIYSSDYVTSIYGTPSASTTIQGV